MAASVESSDMEMDIRQFYNGKSVFITGATGFIGKVVVEKLLRCCADIKAIYFFIRPKKGLSCEERLDRLFQLPLFKTLNEKNPDARSKVIPIQGDITHKALGISDEDRKQLIDNVDIIMHSAATIKFNEPIRVAMEMNFIAVKEIIALAKDIKHLKVLCHVSTAYSQCISGMNNEMIREQFYHVDVESDRILQCMEWMNDKMLEGFTGPLLDKYPNTYTFTKALAEHLLQKESEHLPIMIVRPSIVSSSISDPFPISRGIIRTLHVPNKKHDLVPVDFVSNCIISSTWYHGVSRDKAPLICNCTSGGANPFSLCGIGDLMTRLFTHKHPLNSIFRRPNFKTNTNRYVYQYWNYVSHYVPAIILDSLSMVVGSKPRLVDMYKKIDFHLKTLDYFIQNEWQWENTQLNRIHDAIPESEKLMFGFDMTKINWNDYYEQMLIGIKHYLVKEDCAELPKARNLHLRYKMVGWLSSTIFILMAGRFFFLKSERFKKLWFEALFCIYRFLQYFIACKFTKIHRVNQVVGV